MTISRVAQMTQDEYDAWCWTTELRTEFVDGQVVTLSPETQRDDGGRLFLGAILQAFVEEHRLGTTQGPNYQVRLRKGLRRLPDLLFVANLHTHRIQDSHLEGAPDLVVEFVSCSSVRRDRFKKFHEYEQAGVGEYWLVDTRQGSVDAFVLREDGCFVPLPVEDGVLRSRTVPGFWIRTNWLIPASRPRITEALRELGVV